MAREETVHRLVGGRYNLLEPLGRGGMGTVWRAHDELLQRKVAVKHVAIPPALGPEGGSVRDRVMREAQAAARLSHPASVTVFDVLEDHGSVYIVMELVEAETLAEHVDRRGPMAGHEAARLGLELVGALEAAHRQGIIHRDVKPSNVMVLPSGGVKLTDFGIASVKDHPSLTSTGQVLGSPSYMAPEQALGQQSGEEVDWWGLGATLYFALEGRPPFDRPGALPTLTAVVNEDPAPTERAGTMSPLLGRLLAKEPALRPGAPELRTLLRPHAEPTDETDPAPRAGVSGDTLVTPPTTDAPPPAAPSPVPPPAAPPTTEPAEPATRRPDGLAPAATGEAGPVRERAVVPPDSRPAPVLASPRGTRTPAVAALLAVVALLVGLIAWASSTGDEGRRATLEPNVPATEGAAGNQDRPAPTTPTTAGPTGEGVPADWVTYTDPKVGYRVAHPPSWQVRPLDGTRTDITDPATGTYLRLDWTDTPGPSPEAAWEAQSKSFGARHDQYEEIRIEPTTYKGFDAAIWEYAYSARGARLHAVNLGMVTGKYGFALNFQTSEERWGRSQSQFEAFKASFQVPG